MRTIYTLTILVMLLAAPELALSKTTMFNLSGDIGVVVGGGVPNEKSARGSAVYSLQLLLNIDGSKYFNHTIGYNSAIDSPTMGFEIVDHNRWILSMGGFINGMYSKTGYFFKNEMSLTMSVYDQGLFVDTGDNLKSYLTIETGWRF